MAAMTAPASPSSAPEAPEAPGALVPADQPATAAGQLNAPADQPPLPARVVVFGSINMDVSIAAPRMPGAGETISGSGFVTNPGGKGANQAVAAARLGAEVRMIGAVGDDAFGRELLAGLRGYGVGCDAVQVLPGVTSGVAVIVRAEGDNRIILHAGANHALDATRACELLRRTARPGDVLLAQAECDAEATHAVLRAAHDLGMYVVYNTAPARPTPEGVWADVDLACVNETEAELLTGVAPEGAASRERALDWLLARGAGAAVITLGVEGSVAREAGGTVLSVSAMPARAVDTTAAGDTFLGALAAAHVRGLPLAEAMRWGAAASSIAVMRVGAQASTPTLAELEARLAG